MSKALASIDDLIPDEHNANRGTERGRALLESSLRAYGAGRSVVADKHGKLIAGNKTLEEAAALGFEIEVVKTRGEKLVVVQREDLDLETDEAARMLAYADNRVGQVSLDWDPAVVAADREAGLDLSGLWSDGEIGELLSAVPQEAAADDPGAQIDRAEELRDKWQTEYGQLWEIPSLSVVGRSHRLLCGDSTKAEDVARLMAGERAEMIWTDPPYGVAVGDKNKFLNSIAPSNRVEDNLDNDTLDEPGLIAMLNGAFDCAMSHCLAGGAWYVAAPAGPLHVLFGQSLKERGIWHQTIQWVKNNATFSPMGVDYHWRSEPIFYGWLPGGGHRYYGGRKQDTVWEIDRPLKSPEHPTMKPVELVSRAIDNSSLRGQIVYDAFLGSGTTMVAAEQTGRLCYGMEIAPKYVAVALERLAGMGLEPRLVEGDTHVVG